MAQGRHKVFLGMAVGVGKTCRMLQEAHAEADKGRDVVIGLLETHGRPYTAALARGFELLPRRRVHSQRALLEEMDLRAVLEREPEIALIDEIAHTNVTGLEHAKRYEDVQEILAAGITVFSTVNVQHLQSVSERVSEATGIVVSETLPDGILDDADEVVVVDLTPEALHARIREGKVFPSESVPASLRGFFTKEHLDMLREMALMQVVEEVEAHRLTAEMLGREERLISNASAEHEHHFLALVKPEESANRVIRRAWEMSGRIGGSLAVLWVAPSRRSGDGVHEARVEDLRRLAAVFGAQLTIERDRNVTRAVERVIDRQPTTHLVMGIPHKRALATRRSLVDELARVAPALNITLVGEREASPSRAPAR